MGSHPIRDGKGHRAYRRKQAALKRRTARENLPCGYGSPHGWGCGQSIDATLPSTDRMSFTADHPDAVGNGGHLVHQDLVPMHLSCNSRKGDAAPVKLEGWEAS